MKRTDAARDSLSSDSELRVKQHFRKCFFDNLLLFFLSTDLETKYENET